MQFILENIWAVYDAVLLSQHRFNLYFIKLNFIIMSQFRDKEKIKKITSALGLKMTPREFSHTDRTVQLAAIFTQWLPLADAVLKMAAHHLPSPLDMTSERVEKLLTNQTPYNSLPVKTRLLKEGNVM